MLASVYFKEFASIWVYKLTEGGEGSWLFPGGIQGNVEEARLSIFHPIEKGKLYMHREIMLI